MAAYSLNSYLSKVSQAWQVGDGDLLATLLSFQVGRQWRLKLILHHRIPTKVAELFKLLTPRLRYKQMFAALDVIVMFLLHL